VAATKKSGKRHSESDGFSEINGENWREFDEVLTDSLWLLGKRDSSGAHTGSYHGNFVPQIPRQLLLRFSKKGDWVVDPFCGSGTTMIESKRLGRNCIGIDLNRALVESAIKATETDPEAANSIAVVNAFPGDCKKKTAWDLAASMLPKSKNGFFDLAILHPPYHDIIKFNDDPACLSNCKSLEDFFAAFSGVLKLAVSHLAHGRFLAIVIGDKYEKGEWIPLGFRCMQLGLDLGLSLKGIVVKDIQDNRAKRNLENLWRVRALKSGFYIFKHEYILVFRKPSK
jgi:hypothetical protein